MLDYLLWKSGARQLAFPEFGINQELPFANTAMRIEAAQRIVRWMNAQGLDTTGRNDVLRSLSERLGVDYQPLLKQRLMQILTGNEVSRLSRAGVDFQLHTHRHRTPGTQPEFEREIEENRSRIMEFTGKTPEHFCYPSGKYASSVAGWLANCGIVSATTCEPGLARSTSDPFRLQRVLDNNNPSDSRFEGFLAGFVFSKNDGR